MSQYLIDELDRKPNVDVRTGGEIVRCIGEGRLDCVKIRNRADGSVEDVNVHAVFIFIGADAITDWLPSEVVRDERGYVCTGRDVTDLIPERLAARARPLSAGDERPGHLRGRRRPPRQHQARGLGRRRGEHRDRLRARAPGRSGLAARKGPA